MKNILILLTIVLNFKKQEEMSNTSSNGSLASLVNKSQIMSRAFYKCKEVCYLFMLCSWETMRVHIKKVSSFLTELIDVISFIFPYFSPLFCMSQEIRFCVSKMLHVKKGFTGHLRYYFCRLKQRDVILKMPCFCFLSKQINAIHHSS